MILGDDAGKNALIVDVNGKLIVPGLIDGFLRPGQSNL